MQDIRKYHEIYIPKSTLITKVFLKIHQSVTEKVRKTSCLFKDF